MRMGLFSAPLGLGGLVGRFFVASLYMTELRTLTNSSAWEWLLSL